MLSRPVDSDSTQNLIPPMEEGYYKFQVTKAEEWGSNKDLEISGLTSKMDAADSAAVNVLSIRWELQVVEDSRYDGSQGKPQTRMWFTTYWASDEKLEEVYQRALNKYLEKNPTATEEEARDNMFIWKPQTNLFEFLHACDLMDVEETDDSREYIPKGWVFGQEAEAVAAAINSVVVGKIGPQKYGDRQYKDALLKVIKVREK